MIMANNIERIGIHYCGLIAENNKWLLGSDYLKIIDERRIDTEHIADFLMKSNDGFVDVVEIKKPNNMNFWSISLDHGNYVPSSELTKAITQCQKYLYEIERESNSMKMNERIEFTPIAAPTCLLILEDQMIGIESSN